MCASLHVCVCVCVCQCMATYSLQLNESFHHGGSFVSATSGEVINLL